MALSKTAICNLALSRLGDKPRRISSFDDDTGVIATYCQDYYDAARDEALSRADWPCAREVAELTVEDEAPIITAWSYKYARPDDCVLLRKVIDLAGNEYPFYEITDEDGAMIYSNAVDAHAIYTFLNDNPATYNPGLVELLYWTLAEKLALAVTSKPSIQAAMLQSLNTVVDRMARAKGGIEHYIEDEGGTTPWTDGY